MKRFVAISLIANFLCSPALASQDVEVVRLCLSTARYMEAVGQFAKTPLGSMDQDASQMVAMAQSSYLEDVELFAVVAGPDATAVLMQVEAPLGEYLGKSARCAKFNLCDASQADGLLTLAGALRVACKTDFKGAN